MSEKPKIVDSDLQNNPFTINNDFKIDVKVRTDFHTFRKVGGLEKPNEYAYDVDKCTKVFISHNKRVSISLLKSYTQRLILWLIYELESGKDYIWINKGRYMKENHLKDVRVYKHAIDDLIRYKYILPVGISFYKDVYWINPYIFFCGSRVEKYNNKLNILQ